MSVVPLSKQTIETIRKAVSEIVRCLDRMDAERDAIKAIIDEHKEILKPALLRKVAKAIQQGKTGEVESEHSDLIDVLQALSDN